MGGALLQLGLVDLPEPAPQAALTTARALAEGIARNSPQAMRLSKRAIWCSMEHGYQRAMEQGWSLLKGHWNHPDFVEGPAAFAEGRAAVWHDSTQEESAT